MNSTLIQNLQKLRASYLQRQIVLESSFPLQSLLELYLRHERRLYLNHFEELKLLIQWLAPISLSKKPRLNIPTWCNSYEVNELAKLTGNHYSQIWQELFDLNEELQQCLKKY